MLRQLGALSVLFCAVMMWGCDDEDPTPTDCTDVVSPCETEGEVICNAENSGIATCQENADGCLEYTITTTCGDHQTCDASGDAPVCQCDNGCDTAGAVTCEGNSVATCTEDSDGCLYYEMEDCEATGGTCDDTGDTPECVAGCNPANECTTLDELRCQGNVLQNCEVDADDCQMWTDETNCAEDGQICDDTGKVAACVDEVCGDCTEGDADRCTTEGAVESCVEGKDGCWNWTVTDPCDEPREFCNATADPVICDSCTDDCDTAGAMQCSDDATAIEECEMQEDGCMDWVTGTDCSALDPAQECIIFDEEAMCNLTVDDGTCETPVAVTLPFRTVGSDFAADFSDDMRLTGADCNTSVYTGAVEVVFSVDLTSGETLVIDELGGGLDSAIHVQTTCGAEEACAVSNDYERQEYTAEADGTVYVTIEAWYDDLSTRDSDYDILMFIRAETEVCDTFVDDDLDGLVNCDDSDCFGIAPCDVEELNCEDGEDNDGDEAIDCDDDDCLTDPNCIEKLGIYETFEIGDPASDIFDIGGTSLIFTPSDTDPMGYTWELTEGITEFPYEAGDTTLDLGDDDYAEYTFVNLTEFTFFGETYTSFFVESNGYVSFGSYVDEIIDTIEEFFEAPMICALCADLNPDPDAYNPGGGTVSVNDTAERIVVTFADVPFYDSDTVNSFQFAINSDGSIEIYYLDIPLEGFASDETTTVGISAGPENTLIPDETDYFEQPAEICDDGMDNEDLDDLADCADPECFDATECAEICDDGFDNADLDDLADCDDPECFGVGTCGDAELNCWDGEDNDDDGSSDCADDDCSDSWACGDYLTINEIAYDDHSTDDYEFIELYYSGGDMSLDGYTIVHMNGNDSGDDFVWAIDLTGQSTNSDGFFTVGMVPPVPIYEVDMEYPDGETIQNGPDTLILYTDWDGTTGTVVDAVQFETGGDVPGEGDPSPGIGHGSWNTSIGRYPDGADIHDNSVDVLPALWPTPGFENEPPQPAGYERQAWSAQDLTEFPMSIPDGDDTGISAQISGGTWLGSEIADVLVGVRIFHGYRGDLFVTLTSPSGTTVQLHDMTGSSDDDIIGVYDTVLTPVGNLDDFIGEDPQGDHWTLHVSDRGAIVSGDLIEWVLWVLPAE